MKKLLIQYFLVFKTCLREFNDDKVMKLSASLSYYTIFSIAPMLMVIISLCGIFLGEQAVQGELFEQIRTYVGDEAAIQIQGMIGSLALNKGSLMASIIGLATMLIGATGVFIEIQDSINFMWGIKVKVKKGFLKTLLNRLLAIAIVLGMGLVLLLSLALNGILIGFASKIQEILPWVPLDLIAISNTVLTLSVLCSLFIVVFMVLPDAVIRFKDALIGSMFTTLLFMLGKWGIGLYLGFLTVNSTYGAAASIIIILLWVYYSAIILYFGAEFTQAYADHIGAGIKPKSYAVLVKKKEFKN